MAGREKEKPPLRGGDSEFEGNSMRSGLSPM